MYNINQKLEKIKADIDASKERRNIIDEECLTDLQKQIVINQKEYLN